MSRRPARRARTAAALLVVGALALVAVLVGLVGTGGSQAGPAGSGTGAGASATPATGAPTSRTSPRTRDTRASPTASRDAQPGLPTVALRDLPPEAQQTVALIDAGGPFPYAQDGVTFGNYERVLPAHPRGWYREYTVRTPGERDRGPRRIVTGDDDRLLFYTPDHYASFLQVSR